MTLTFPRELPAVDFLTADVVLRDPVASAASGGGRMNYTQIGDPVWEASLVTAPLLYSQFAAVEAWWLSLREGLRRVLFQHPHVCYPFAHSGALSGLSLGVNPLFLAGNSLMIDAGDTRAASLAAVTNGNQLTVNGVSAGLTLIAGDRIGLERSGRYYVGRVTEVSGSGTTRTIVVEPPPPETVSQAGAVVRFSNPNLLMRPIPASYSAPRNGRFYTVSFKLIESL